MQKNLIGFCFIFLLSSCTKNKMSSNTGTLEVSWKGSQYESYLILTKEQLYRYNEHNTYEIFRSGGYSNVTILEKNIPQGEYGIVVNIDRNWNSIKTIYIEPNKINKIQMP